MANDLSVFVKIAGEASGLLNASAKSAASFTQISQAAQVSGERVAQSSSQSVASLNAVSAASNRTSAALQGISLINPFNQVAASVGLLEQALSVTSSESFRTASAFQKMLIVTYGFIKAIGDSNSGLVRMGQSLINVVDYVVPVRKQLELLSKALALLYDLATGNIWAKIGSGFAQIGSSIYSAVLYVGQFAAALVAIGTLTANVFGAVASALGFVRQDSAVAELIDLLVELSGVTDLVVEKFIEFSAFLIGIPSVVGAFALGINGLISQLSLFFKALQFAKEGVKVFAELAFGISDLSAVSQGLGLSLEPFERLDQLFGALLFDFQAGYKTFINSIAAFAKVEDQIAQIGTLFLDLDPGDRAEKIGQVTDELLRLSAVGLKNSVSAENTAKAYYSLLSAFPQLADSANGSAEGMRVLESGLKLSSASGAEANTTLNALSRTMIAYRIATGDAATTAAKLNEVALVGNTTVPQFAGNIGQLTSTASQLGISLDETLGTFASLTTLFSSDDSITGLNSLMGALITLTPQAKAQLKALGVEVNATTIAQDGLLGTLDKISTALGGNKDALAQIIPDNLAFRTALALTGPLANSAAEAIEKVSKATGDRLEDAFGTRNQGSIQRINSLMVGFNSLLEKVGQEAIKGFNGPLTVAENFLAFLQELPQPVQAFLGQIVVLNNLIGGMATVSGRVVTTIAILAGVFVAFRVAVVLLNAQLYATVAALVATGQIRAAILTFLGLESVLNGTTGALIAQKAAWLANAAATYAASFASNAASVAMLGLESVTVLLSAAATRLAVINGSLLSGSFRLVGIGAINLAGILAGLQAVYAALAGGLSVLVPKLLAAGLAVGKLLVAAIPLIATIGLAVAAFKALQFGIDNLKAKENAQKISEIGLSITEVGNRAKESEKGINGLAKAIQRIPQNFQLFQNSFELEATAEAAERVNGRVKGLLTLVDRVRQSGNPLPPEMFKATLKEVDDLIASIKQLSPEVQQRLGLSGLEAARQRLIDTQETIAKLPPEFVGAATAADAFAAALKNAASVFSGSPGDFASAKAYFDLVKEGFDQGLVSAEEYAKALNAIAAASGLDKGTTEDPLAGVKLRLQAQQEEIKLNKEGLQQQSEDALAAQEIRIQREKNLLTQQLAEQKISREDYETQLSALQSQGSEQRLAQYRTELAKLEGSEGDNKDRIIELRKEILQAEDQILQARIQATEKAYDKEIEKIQAVGKAQETAINSSISGFESYLRQLDSAVKKIEQQGELAKESNSTQQAALGLLDAQGSAQDKRLQRQIDIAKKSLEEAGSEREKAKIAAQIGSLQDRQFSLLLQKQSREQQGLKLQQEAARQQLELDKQIEIAANRRLQAENQISIAKSRQAELSINQQILEQQAEVAKKGGASALDLALAANLQQQLSGQADLTNFLQSQTSEIANQAKLSEQIFAEREKRLGIEEQIAQVNLDSNQEQARFEAQQSRIQAQRNEALKEEEKIQSRIRLGGSTLSTARTRTLNTGVATGITRPTLAEAVAPTISTGSVRERAERQSSGVNSVVLGPAISQNADSLNRAIGSDLSPSLNRTAESISSLLAPLTEISKKLDRPNINGLTVNLGNQDQSQLGSVLSQLTQLNYAS